jgi:protein TonB
MLDTLLESRSTRRRSAGGTIVSVAAHTALIAAAVYATAQARVAPGATPQLVRPVYFPSPPTPVKAMPNRRSASPADVVRRLPVIQSIDIELPPIPDVHIPVATDGTFHSRALDGSGTEPVGTSGDASGEAYTAGQVEKQVEVAPGNAPPRYPDALRDRGVEGSVVAQFVVDAAGRVEDGSVRFVRSDNVLFEAAVRTALMRMRFVPAEVGGRKVRQLVQMPFVFTIGR